MERMRIVYFGMGGILSLRPLEALLMAGMEVCAVIVPAKGHGVREKLPPSVVSELPMLGRFFEQSIVQIGWEAEIPVVEAGDLRSEDFLKRLQGFRADVACVSCFSKKIPAEVLAVPRYGFLNVHPSLLPAYRGPEPLFWVARSGQTAGGVTIHQMDEGWDSGDIVLQRQLSWEVGIAHAELEAIHAAVAGRLLVEAVQKLSAGEVVSRPQEGTGSYARSPQDEDFRLDVTWPVSRAFNFVRGTEGWQRPYPVSVNGQHCWLKGVSRIEDGRQLKRPLVFADGEIGIQFADGVLWGWGIW